MPIALTSGFLEVTKTRKTRAEFWKDVQIGDTIRLDLDVYAPYRHYQAGLHVTNLRLTNVTTGQTGVNGLSQLTHNMAGFEFAGVETTILPRKGLIV